MRSGLFSSLVNGREFQLINDNSGFDQNRTTGSAYSRMTAEIHLFWPMLLEKVLWDVYGATNYTLREVTTLIGTTVVQTFVSGQAVTQGADREFIIPPANRLLLPGIHFIQLVRDSGTSNWYDLNAALPGVTTYWQIQSMAYTTTVQTAYTPPLRLVGNIIKFNPINLL